MEKPLPKNNPEYFIQLALIAVAAAVILFVWEGHTGFSLWDEGYLWYDVQRTMMGEVPTRDFMAYDPGRYYWSAAIMSLMGDNGIVALRVALAIFQAIGLFIGLVLVSRNATKSNLAIWLAVALIVLAIWMLPRHKIFDISISIAQVGALAFLVHKPSIRRYFLAGLCVGLFAVFGRNHGLYGLVGGLGVMAYLAYRRESGPALIKAFAAWSAGIMVGYLPMLIMFVSISGFASAFWDGIHYLLFEFKATNFPLPIPWPWRVPFGQIPLLDAVRGVLNGLFYIGLIVFGVLSIAWVFIRRSRKQPVAPQFVAAAFMVLPYAHYAYSRADINHLAQGIFPFLIGCLVFLSTRPAKIKWPFAALLCGASLLVIFPTHPGWKCRVGQNCVDTDVAGDNLRVDVRTASAVALLKQLDKKFASGDRSFMVAPFWPGAYAVLKKKSPIWEIYPIKPQSLSFQEKEIQRIEKANPGFILIIDAPLDGRDELRYRNTHPVIEQYIHDHYDRMTGIIGDPAFQLYTSRN